MFCKKSQKEMGSKGLKSVIMCVLILGIIYEVEGKSCCMSTQARNCYKICRLNFAPAICAITCDCIIIKGKICPRGYPKLNLLPNSSKRRRAISILLLFIIYFSGTGTYLHISCLIVWQVNQMPLSTATWDVCLLCATP